ncbi:Protein CBG23188 [Caenorhabditis briggsae]|uniref:Uncharacterized protein n=2 Tax=Caenorhabditis briggsae TaxID=6238 RepID=A0AAE9F479_CAEBR|nr:Protein CBG23188 [Caenorhabditis briggsae]ULT89171.1 hypothetical protein L3Y34_007973 [Caenorhabditis briggsae]UMM35003.1 hypothetical protein L5515_007822 [Caenorhabditis briggsae]CAP39796.1 Protein CBG23188 [Caenorhabditis briggsae]
MKLLSIVFFVALFTAGVAFRKAADQSSAFLDHGEIVLEDKPDIPGNIAGPDGNLPTHVTFSDVEEEATTKIIYQR